MSALVRAWGRLARSCSRLASLVAAALVWCAVPALTEAQGIWFSEYPGNPSYSRNVSAQVTVRGYTERYGCGEWDYSCEQYYDYPNGATFAFYANDAPQSGAALTYVGASEARCDQYAPSGYCEYTWTASRAGAWHAPDATTSLRTEVQFDRGQYYATYDDNRVATVWTSWTGAADRGATYAFTGPRNCDLSMYWHEAPQNGHPYREGYFSLAHYVWDWSPWYELCPPPYSVDLGPSLTYNLNGTFVDPASITKTAEWSTTLVPLQPLAPGETSRGNSMRVNVRYRGTAGYAERPITREFTVVAQPCRAGLTVDQAPPDNTTAATGDFAFSWRVTDPNTGGACPGAVTDGFTFVLNGTARAVELLANGTSARATGVPLRPFSTNEYRIQIFTTDPNPGRLRTPTSLPGSFFARGSVGVAVTPAAPTAAPAPNTRTRVRFAVQNTDGGPATFNFTARCTGAATGGAPLECAPNVASKTLAAGATDSVAVSYTAAGARATGAIELTAARTDDASRTANGSVSVTVADGGLWLVYRKGRPVELRSLISDNHCAEVAEASRAEGAQVRSWACLGSAVSRSLQQKFAWMSSGELKVYGGTADEKCVSLAGGVTTTNGTDVVVRTCAGSADQKWEPSQDGLEIRVVGTTKCLDISGNNLAYGTKLVISDCVGANNQRWRPGPESPFTLALDTLRSGTGIERDQCLTVAVGPGAAYECGDLRLTHVLPTVRTLNAVRAPTLLYNSRHANAELIVPVDVTLGGDAPVPTSVLVDAAVRPAKTGVAWRGLPQATMGGADWATGGTRRVVVPIDMRADTSGLYQLRIVLTPVYAGQPGTAAGVTRDIALVNRASSPFGRGWWMAGLERLVIVGNGRLLWIGGDGSAHVYIPTRRAGDPSPPPCVSRDVNGVCTSYSVTGVWAAGAVDRPDTLVQETTTEGTFYVRRLASGTRVRFDQFGRHVGTVNRLGHTTAFTYDAGTAGTPLQHLSVPVAGGARPTYTMAYRADGANVARLSAVNAPALPGQSRNVQFWMSQIGAVDSITDPDTTTVRFHTTGSDALVRRRTDRTRFSTNFDFDAGGAVGSAWRNATGGDAGARHGFRAAETQGLARGTDGTSRSVQLASVFTVLDGPRANVSDTTRVWVNAFGGPDRIINPLGDTTWIQRSDTRFPGLVTFVAASNGLRTHARYDARGNVLTDSVENPLGDGRPAVTRYGWDATWNFATTVTRPEGDGVEVRYDAQTGHRLWQQPLNDASRRVTYQHHPTLGLLTSSRATGITGADSVIYDVAALGNVRETRTPRNTTTEYVTDLLGRDTVMWTPISGGARSRVRTQYDVGDRVREQVTWAPAIAGASNVTPIEDSVRVVSRYDLEGRLQRVDTYRGARFANHGALTTQYAHDSAGRVTQELLPGGTRTYRYDEAGNQVRRTEGDAAAVVTTYDALNRARTRVTPARAYAAEHCTAILGLVAGQCGYSMPTRGENVTIPADTAILVYDRAGNMTQADNLYARVRRSYFPNGLVKTDTLRIRAYFALRTPSGSGGPGDPGGGDPPIPPRDPPCGIYGHEGPCPEPAMAVAPATEALTDPTAAEGLSSASEDAAFNAHVYGLTMEYDLNGRRTALHYPRPINGATSRSTRYAYHPQLGALGTVTDLLGNPHSFEYDLAGRLKTVRHPGGVVSVTDYDDDSRERTRSVSFANGSHTDSWSYDLRSKVTEGASTTTIGGIQNYAEASATSYDGLGAVVASDRNSGGTATHEDFTVDALGNRLAQHGSQDVFDPTDPTGERTLQYNALAQLDWIKTPERGGLGPKFVETYAYDGSGSTATIVTREERELNPPPCGSSCAEPTAVPTDRSRGGPSADATAELSASRDLGWRFTATKNYYGADGRLYVFNRHVGIDSVSAQAGPARRGVFEEYRYDALGRRVLVRSRRDRTCISRIAAGASWDKTDCANHTTRVVWDGDQIAVELRGPGGDAETTESDATYVEYSHAAGIDAPVLALKYGTAGVTPVPGWRGSFVFGTLPDGTACPNGCNGITWPGRDLSVDRGLSGSGEPGLWFGGLLAEQADGSGLQYMRNRYFDPKTGRFTQQDPIGLAGGLNLYGFAAGDPVNFSDPFGLKPCKLFDASSCTAAEWASQIGDAFVSSLKQTFRELVSDLGNPGVVFGGRVGAGTRNIGGMRRWQFEGATYHGRAASGRKSAGPVNGQDALDFSVGISPNTSRRVGIDYEAGAFVVFDETGKGSGRFHGHVRTWDQLEDPMKNALRQNNLVNRRGDIIRVYQ